MPRRRIAASAEGIRGSVFSSLAHRIDSFEGEVYPFHVGDTWLEPAEGCRMQDLRVEDHDGLHRYAPPSGLPPLLDRLLERTRARSGVPVEPDQIQISAGATGGLSALLGVLLEPGDEVLVLAPYWPLIDGLVRSRRGVPRPVPFLGQVESLDQVTPAVEAELGERTVALYLSSPNNPTGRVIPPTWIDALVAWAGRHDLWVISDDVYEDHLFRGDAVSCFALDPERVFSAHSFSKSYGMAGNRCGWIVGPTEPMAAVARLATHTFYSAPTASQVAAARLLERAGDEWLADSVPRYRQMGERAADLLGVPRPEGSSFLFLDVAPHLDERGLLGFLEDCADDGLFLAPGPSFGPYPTHVRLCYTAAPPDVTLRGLEKLARCLGTD